MNALRTLQAGALPYRAMSDTNWQLTAASAFTYPTVSRATSM
jgi:hypothetical protein